MEIISVYITPDSFFPIINFAVKEQIYLHPKLGNQKGATDLGCGKFGLFIKCSKSVSLFSILLDVYYHIHLSLPANQLLSLV